MGHLPENYSNMQKLISENQGRELNEADTRHRVIDVVLHQFLMWPKNRVSVEEYIAPGFADYVLKKENGNNLFFIEAKKDGNYFELPIAYKAEETSCYIPLKLLNSDEKIRKAVQQVRMYCVDAGCEFAGITNGHEWIVFKAFEKGKRFDELQAFVIRNLNFFLVEYTKAINSFSFTAITENSSLHSLLGSAYPKDRGTYYPKEKVPSYSHTISQNRLAATLRPFATRYFGVIGDDDTDFMERCYVAQREHHGTLQGMHNVIHDSLSPYFAERGVKQLDDTGKGGQLGGRLTKQLKKGRGSDVLVLFGGKGSGKSTFIKRLLHHNPPRWLREHAIVAIVNLLNVPENREVIRTRIWDDLLDRLDTNKILDQERDFVITQLYSEKFSVALKQDLAGLNHASEAFNLKLNELVSGWKNDKIYTAKSLVNHWSKDNRGCVVVIDNTDQYSSDTQDFCFASAQEIAEILVCTVIISMREERFHNSKIHGVLDAYQNAGFHISSPKPSEVFKKRLEYTTTKLEFNQVNLTNSGDHDNKLLGDSIMYMQILKREFSSETSPLNSFLTACAHGDTRLSLDLFRSFLLSGYTNVDEMISVGRWNFKMHQVLKPVMIPDRYFYDEGLSEVPNLFQPRSNRHASHFTTLRVLRRLAKNLEKSNPSYHSVAELRSYFSETFDMVEDLEKSLDVLLKHGVVEANNRLDYFSIDVDSIKITSYGLYLLRELPFDFTYLDLVCTDCGVYDEATCNYLIEAAKREYALFLRNERVERVKVRLERVETFIQYLKREELRERNIFGLNIPESEMFTHGILNSFEKDRSNVLRSAKKQKNGTKRT